MCKLSGQQRTYSFPCVTLLCIGTFYSCNGMYVPISAVMKYPSGQLIKLKITKVNLLEISRFLLSIFSAFR